MDNESIYAKLSHLIFSGDFDSGSALVERDLAHRLGVSRVPVRESLTQMVAQGALEGGRRREGVRIRRYSSEEISQLYDYRAAVEGGIAFAAARNASDASLLRLGMICDEMELLLDDDDPLPWGKLDGKFHEALAEASGNDRFNRTIKSLLRECFYVFHILSRRCSRITLTPEAFVSHKHKVLEDHRAVVSFIESRDAENAERQIRSHILRSADRLIRMHIASGIEIHH